jgi:hypothetical protein
MKTWNTPTVIGLPMTTAQWLLESGARFDAPTIELLRGIALRRHRRPLTEREVWLMASMVRSGLPHGLGNLPEGSLLPRRGTWLGFFYARRLRV